MLLEVSMGLLCKQWIYHTEEPALVMQARMLAHIRHRNAIDISANHSTQ